MMFSFALSSVNVLVMPSMIAVTSHCACPGATAGARELGSTVQADADRLVDAIANSLQAFFAKQGWTAAPPPSYIPSL